MHVYRFRVTFEDYEDISRDIDIRSDQSFQDMQSAILQSISFEKEMPSSFYMSNDNWIKGTEISSIEKTDKAGNPIVQIQDAKLKNFISDPHQKIYFVFDLEVRWTFFIELIKILNSQEGELYPKCVKSVGAAPKQFFSIENISVEDEGYSDDFIEEDAVENEDDTIFSGVDEGETEDMETEGEEEEMNEEGDETSEMEEEY